MDARPEPKGKGRARAVGRPRARSKTRAERPKLIEEDPAISERLLKDQLRVMGLYAAPTIGDGNCLFRALSDQLYGSPEAHVRLRHDVCEFISSNAERYRLFVDEDSVPGGFDGHLASMRVQGTYGTHIELSALAQLYRRPIKVVQPGLVYIIKTEEPASGPVLDSAAESALDLASTDAVRVTPDGESRDVAATSPDLSPEAEAGLGTLFIVYHSWEHYSSLRNLGGPHVGLPKVEEIIPNPLDPGQASLQPKQDSAALAEPAPAAPQPSKRKAPSLPAPAPAMDPATGLPLVPVKRGRGRPRKYPLAVVPAASTPSEASGPSARPPLRAALVFADADTSKFASPSLAPRDAPGLPGPSLALPHPASSVVRTAGESLATTAPTLSSQSSSSSRPSPQFAPPHSLSEHLQQTLRKHRPPDSTFSLSPVLYQRSRHESAEESSTGSTPVGSLSSESSASSPASEPAEVETSASDRDAGRARPSPSGDGQGTSSKERRDKRLAEKRRKAEVRNGGSGGEGLRRSKRGLPAAEGVLGEVKELHI